MWLLGTPVWLRFVRPIAAAMTADKGFTRLGGNDADLRIIRAEKAYFIARLASEVEIHTKKEHSVREALPGYFRRPYRHKSLHLVFCSLKYRRRAGSIVQLVAEHERLYAISVISGELVVARQEFVWRGK